MDAAVRERLVKLIAMTGSSHDGEVINAARAADSLLKQHKLSWREALLPNGRDSDNEPVTRLRAEVDLHRRECASLKAKNERLNKQLATLRVLETEDRVGLGTGPASKRARRVLQLVETGAATLNEFEREFMQTISGWTGQLTDRQFPVFVQIMRKVTMQTGQVPS
jgi:hypothetical protein